MSTKMKSIANAAFVKSIPVFFRLLKAPYWGVLRVVINNWGRRGLHSITVGEFEGGTSKTRSLYREDMLLKTIMLFVNLRGKSCLDLACNDGFWSFRLARFGLKSATGVEAANEAVSRANFLKYVYDLPSFQFVEQDIFAFLYNEDRSKSYDVVLLLSILYHLPEQTDWNRFFGAISRINSQYLIIDSRWFEDDAYWYDKTSVQALKKTEQGAVKKWRPSRKEVFDYLARNGYEQVIEINPSAFLPNAEAAYGDGDPYSLANVSDYITNNRTLIIGYKSKEMVPISALRWSASAPMEQGDAGLSGLERPVEYTR